MEAYKVALHHRTWYRYANPVVLGPHQVRLRPAPHCRTSILSYSLRVTPPGYSLYWQQDPHGNFVARLIFPEERSELAIDVDLVADLTPINPFNFLLEPGFEQYPFRYPRELEGDLAPYRATKLPTSRLQAFLASLSWEKRATIVFLTDLNRRVSEKIRYCVRLEQGVQSPEQTLEKGTGSCRDSAWLLVEALRHAGVAARFVSGYLIQMAQEEQPGTDAGSRPSASTRSTGVETGAADLHAWAEAYVPGAGWIGLDPTSGLLTAEGHIPLAATPHPGAASPISGTANSRDDEFDYSLSVRRLDRLPGIREPFTEAAWRRVRQVAHTIDMDLESRDVRLTMGGEPTFVGMDEPERAEWNATALGARKRERALDMIRRIQEQIAPGGLLHFGQGKWYPGEALPRWAFSCHWRLDGIPIWERPDLIAGSGTAEAGQEEGVSTPGALTFITALTRRLRLNDSSILAAYEQEDAPPADPAGYVLPLRRRHHDGRSYWSGKLWFPLPERLVLLQGSSPAGYRLPLTSLPWVAPDREQEADSSVQELPPHVTRNQDGIKDLFEAAPVEDPLPAIPEPAESSLTTIRPALAVEAREGRLHVFLPYAAKLADYLDLARAVEDTCAFLHQPVWIEGYTPPADPRLRSFSITPDPGVLEVNLPPASNWDELEGVHTLASEEARRSQLTAEKFLPNGRHTATGGGNHIVIGGPSVADSPLLRRPDLLRSMLTFWQNHPSLSYFFSGMFIGPWSQYPRVDEVRMDLLYEMEIAFSQLAAAEGRPELLDGLFRNLLIDLTGNTHRAEFCIDKLYCPEGLGLRLGLLELRAFEMTPHVRMALAELLLVRGLVARFWKEPYQARLIRWGTALHDRFLLPHYVKEDLSAVLGFLERSGYAFEQEWFQSHFEFRFPLIGSIEIGSRAADGVELELRQALEPWHVLGEEATSEGTVRSVDSSLERLEVKLSGPMAESRFAVLCNGRRVPLEPTDKGDEAVAGVRYRVRQLPSTLHPTIAVQTPLVFDVVDLWEQRAAGGCTFHPAFSPGHDYDDRPANAQEAERRRQERFERRGHEPGPATAPEVEKNPAFPMTLDLRWPLSHAAEAETHS